VAVWLSNKVVGFINKLSYSTSIRVTTETGDRSYCLSM